MSILRPNREVRGHMDQKSDVIWIKTSVDES